MYIIPGQFDKSFSSVLIDINALIPIASLLGEFVMESQIVNLDRMKDPVHHMHVLECYTARMLHFAYITWMSAMGTNIVPLGMTKLIAIKQPVLRNANALTAPSIVNMDIFYKFYLMYIGICPDMQL